jgi:hypothetical protein
MKSTQNVKPQMMSAAQPPKVAGGLFGVRSPRNQVVEMPAGSLGLRMQSNENPAKPDNEGNFETPRVKKQCAGLW